MAPTDIQKVILDVLREIQTESGRPWFEGSSSLKPIGDLAGFDSLCGVEATVALESHFGVAFPTTSIFVSDDGRRARSVKRIATVIAKHLSEKKARA